MPKLIHKSSIFHPVINGVSFTQSSCATFSVSEQVSDELAQVFLALPEYEVVAERQDPPLAPVVPLAPVAPLEPAGTTTAEQPKPPAAQESADPKPETKQQKAAREKAEKAAAEKAAGSEQSSENTADKADSDAGDSDQVF